MLNCMETFSALLATSVGNSSVTSEFPAQRPVTQSFDVSFDQHLNKWLSKQLWGWWFEMPSCPLWCHCNVVCGNQLDISIQSIRFTTLYCVSLMKTAVSYCPVRVSKYPNEHYSDSILRGKANLVKQCCPIMKVHFTQNTHRTHKDYVYGRC